MIDVIIATDDLDGTLGHFFQLCATDLYNALLATGGGKSYNVTQIASAGLTASNIVTAVKGANATNFVFIVFSHGTHTALTRDCQGGEFIDVALGVSHFCQSLFYTFSCSSGRKLGPQLILDGCHSFWGYKNPAWVILGFESHCVDCANQGFKMLLEGNDAETSYYMMLDRYTDTAYYIEEVTNSFIASHLLFNRDNLVLYGNPLMTLNPWKT